jgi:hypothetical protein
MFKNHKLELRVTKNRPEDGMVDATPSITKEDVLHISKNVAKYVVGGVLIVLASAAALDTAKYAAMTGIENRSSKKELED